MSKVPSTFNQQVNMLSSSGGIPQKIPDESYFSVGVRPFYGPYFSLRGQPLGGTYPYI